MDHESFLSRNARFLWLALLFVPPGVAFFTYQVTPHDKVWHDVLFSLFCVPLFLMWVVALIACFVSFALHLSQAHKS